MAGKHWLHQAIKYIKEGKRNKAAQLARKELHKDHENPQALWMIANTSKTHSERYNALLIYTSFLTAENLTKARQMRERYEEHPDLVEKFQLQAPTWITFEESTTQKRRKKILGWGMVLFPIGYLVWRFINPDTMSDIEVIIIPITFVVTVLFILAMSIITVAESIDWMKLINPSFLMSVVMLLAGCCCLSNLLFY